VPFAADVAEFARAVVDPQAALPAAVLGSQRAFSVYRNNVAAGLIGVLEARYPVVRRLVGDAFFRGMAGAYVAARKPRSAVLIHYGGDFPAFVADFPPARDLPYLPDVAALENAWVEAYHAAEADPLPVAALNELDPDALDDMQFVIHPAARALRAKSPAASLWAAHQTAGDPAPPANWAPEEALVTRPQAEVQVRVLPPGGLAMFAALREGATLGQAAAPLLAAGDDPGAHVVGLVAAGAFCGCF